MVNVTINNKKVSVEDNTTIMNAASKAGIFIPRLCFLKEINENSSCRVCVVEVEGYDRLVNSCTSPVFDGMVVYTESKKVKRARRTMLELIASNHTFECWACPREHNCELLRYLKKYNVENTLQTNKDFSIRERIIQDNDTSIVFDSGKCLQCRRCIAACQIQSAVSCIDYNNRGYDIFVGPPIVDNMNQSGCIYCGKCIQACPVAAIKEKDSIDYVVDCINDPDKYVIVQTAPAVRVALGEEFGFPIGTNVEGRMYAALNKLGFDDIIDTNFAADLTILEEGTEFIDRLKNDGPFPMFTSCSPGWIRWIEMYRPDYLEHLSTCKSPHEMLGSLMKNYYYKKIDIERKDIVVVSIMPCIAKKFESQRSELSNEGLQDVDYVLTTRELARLIKMYEIDFNNLDDYQPDSPIASYTGAGLIFGASGGVMEAALRTMIEILENRELNELDFEEVRGMKDIKKATVNIAGIDVKIAVVHGGAAIKDFFKLLDNGEFFHFVEFMGCTGGCINGGGQPIVKAEIQDKKDIRKLRASALYDSDSENVIRKSHENKAVNDLYYEFLKEPCGDISHKLLHTHYKKRTTFETEK